MKSIEDRANGPVPIAEQQTADAINGEAEDGEDSKGPFKPEAINDGIGGQRVDKAAQARTTS